MSEEDTFEKVEKKKAENECRNAKRKLKHAECFIEEEYNKLNILKQKIDNSNTFQQKTEDLIKQNKYSEACFSAKEAINGANEVISSVRKQNLGTARFLFFTLSFLGFLALLAIYGKLWLFDEDLLQIPMWAPLLGLLGAITYSIYGVFYHYYKGDLGLDDIFYYGQRLVQGTLLTIPIYLLLNYLTGTEQLMIQLNNDTINSTENIASMTQSNATALKVISPPDIQLVGLACFLTGLFTKHVIEFLYVVANRLFKLPDRGKKQDDQ